jgi:SagB-type dehydrogenase family enzyme
MAVEEALRLRRDATVDRGGEHPAVLAGFARLALPGPGPLEAAVDLLADGGATELDLARAAMDAGGEVAALPLQQLLLRLRGGGWLERTILDDGRPLATLRPLGHRELRQRRLDPARPVAVSRFALLRADAGELLLESPRAAAQVVLHDPALAAVVASLAAAAAPQDVPAPAALLQLLADAAVVVHPDDEAGDDALAPWTFHELLFHARTRFGRNVGGYGGTYRLQGRQEPLPAVKPVAGVAVPLPVPDLDARQADDVPLAAAMERRRSVRAHDDARPIDAALLGELLYRCARTRATFSDGRQELASRPYPAGGSTYELEVYPLVRLCDGVDPGLYRYDGGGHALELVSPPTPATRSLLEFARVTSVMDAPPQVTLLLASRVGRVAWKYESMAYALTLKQVGVLQQSLYLVATALGLAPCAQGGGDADAFAAASGLDYYAETTVGEFVVGSLPEAT